MITIYDYNYNVIVDVDDGDDNNNDDIIVIRHALTWILYILLYKYQYDLRSKYEVV